MPALSLSGSRTRSGTGVEKPDGGRNRHLDVYKRQDQIIVLDNAHIVQRGTHAELIRQKGLYADFVSARQEAIGWKLYWE